MEQYKVKDLMVPLSEYAVIPKNATIFEAVLALEKTQQIFNQNNYHSRAILVEDSSGKIIGKLSQLDILRALEPKYADIKSEMSGSGKFGFSKQFLLSILETYQMFDKPLDDICRKAGMEKAAKYMQSPTEGECISAEGSLDQAIHLLILGYHQSLLVTHKNEIIGILRLTDVFANISQHMKACGFNK
ncbi:CBS domain-containing protein [Desulfobacterales bacterium HSG17]|nr:CBS domain-containing protein [Desulfobacterales bacterium HSG17]